MKRRKASIAIDSIVFILSIIAGITIGQILIPNRYKKIDEQVMKSYRTIMDDNKGSISCILHVNLFNDKKHIIVGGELNNNIIVLSEKATTRWVNKKTSSDEYEAISHILSVWRAGYGLNKKQSLITDYLGPEDWLKMNWNIVYVEK